ncbi:hypothetical protein [Streptomyces sp. NPDC002467]|uniref:hypothetical protein n=1 Tax=Streptomyces sp. NPDC002467 TaxID=3364647 RepID=UPI00368EE794
MPDWLATYRPELWAGDLEDPLEVHYFGRFRWEEACQEWAQGGLPEPRTEFPRPVQTTSVNTTPIREKPPEDPSPPQGPNYVPGIRRARPIKLH